MSEQGLTIKEALEQSGRVIHKNRGVSMMPMLRANRDLMVIDSVQKKHCKRYDAVLFVRENGQYVLHRIIKEYDNHYLIIGDNCLSGEYVDKSQIIGVLSSFVRNGKTISTSNWVYKLYVYLWCAPWKLRVFITKVKGRLYRLLKLMRSSENED